MIPVADSPQRRSFPYVNVALILINLGVFIYEVYLSQQTIAPGISELDRFIREWGNVPACMFDVYPVIDPTIDADGQQLCDLQPESGITIITAMFLHGSWLHVLSNMLFLWIFGDNVEDTFGHIRYLVFYLLAGVIAGLTHGLMNIDALIPAIGASGAVAGVMGAYIVLFPRATVAVLIPFFFFIPFPIPAFLLIGVWFLFQVLGGFAAFGVEAVGAEGGIAYFAHIGGFIAGLALVTFFALGRPRRRQHPPRRGDRSGAW
jgi:membrane associated rhomboid family serine protease